MKNIEVNFIFLARFFVSLLHKGGYNIHFVYYRHTESGYIRTQPKMVFPEYASQAEFTELFENCNIEYTASENGVNGIRLTSKVAGYEDKSIFIPAGGYKQDNGTMSEGSAACLWTNQCMIGGFSMPEYGFSVNISVLGSYETPTAYRYFGRNVRAVKEKTAE